MRYEPPQLPRITRRRFLYTSTLGTTLFHLAPGRVLGGERLSANEKLNVAGIGIGSQGGGDVDAVAGEGHNIVALCDVDENYAAKKFAQYPEGQAVQGLSRHARPDGQRRSTPW